MKSNNRIKFLECKVALLGAMLSLTVWIFNSSALAGPERIPDKNVVVPQQEVVVPFSWSGFYVGANVGGNWTHSDFGHHFTGVAAGAIEDFTEGETDPGSEEFTAADEDFVTYSIPSASGNSDISFLGGGQLGYQQQFGHFVIGVEVDFDGATGNGDRATTTNNFVTPMFTTPGNTDGDTVISVLKSKHRAEADWQGSFRGRLGYASGRFLFYAAGGAAFTQVRSSARDTLTSNVFDTPAFTPEEGGTQIHSGGPARDDSTLLGWTGGGGVEYALCNAVTLGVEYRHNDFGSDTLQFAKPNPTFVTSGNTRLDLSADQVTLRINILLGHLGRCK